MTKAPLCFILTPLGFKANADGSMIDFDRVYQDVIPQEKVLDFPRIGGSE